MMRREFQMSRTMLALVLFTLLLPAQVDNTATTPAAQPQRRAESAFPRDAMLTLRFAGLANVSTAAADLELVKLARSAVGRVTLGALEDAWSDALLQVDPQADFIWAAAAPLVSVPFAVAITGIDMIWKDGKAQPVPDFLLVAEAGKEAQAFAAMVQTALGNIERRYPLSFDTVRHADTDISVARVNGAGTLFEIATATREGLVLMSLHTASVKEMLDRLADPALQSLGNSIRPLPAGETEVLRLRITPGAPGRAVASLFPRAFAQALAKLGATKDSTIEITSLLRGGTGVTRCQLLGVAEDGLLASLPREPVSEQLLAAIPDTAVMVAATRHDLSALLRTLEGAVREVYPRDMLDDVLRKLSAAARGAGVDIMKDLSPLLGKECVAYFELTRSANVPNVVLMFPGTDGALLQKQLRALPFAAGSELRERDLDGFHILQFIPPKSAAATDAENAADATGAFLSEKLFRSLVRPALAVKDGLAILALNERGLGAAMGRLTANKTPFMQDPLVRRDLGLDAGTPIAFAHLDLRRLFAVGIKLSPVPFPWLDPAGLQAIATTPELLARFPTLSAVFLRQQEGPALEIRGLEAATLLGIASRIMLESGGVPPAAVPHFVQRLKNPEGR